ncbi:MAG: hypothetical protein L0210_07010 [Rhodospirillales bacterium]|nr:hypothetical protein [Rhodospirillales bacterium]
MLFRLQRQRLGESQAVTAEVAGIVLTAGKLMLGGAKDRFEGDAAVRIQVLDGLA